MDNHQEGDVVLVTGGAGGLGSAYCRLLASQGARIVVNDIGGVLDGGVGNNQVAHELAAEIVAAGGQAVGDVNDGATVEGAKAAVQTALDTYGRIDAVIANAGILRDRTFLKTTDEDFFAVVTAHLAGTMRIFHAAMPLMKEQGYGRLVSTTSGSGLFGSFGQSAYGAAKMAIVGLTQALAIEGSRAGITANMIAPMAQTRMTEDLMGDMKGQAPAELVAPLVAHLVSRACEVSGRIYSVGAGRVARADVGVTRGLINTSMTTDWVAENLPEIDAESEYLFLETAADEAGLYT